MTFMFGIDSTREFLDRSVELLASARTISIFGVGGPRPMSEHGEIRVVGDIPSSLGEEVRVIYGLCACGDVCRMVSTILKSGKVTSFYHYVWDDAICSHVLESLTRSTSLKSTYGRLNTTIVRILKESKSIAYVVLCCGNAKDGMDDALCEMISCNDTLERLSLIDFTRFKMGYRKLRSALSSNRSITHYNNLKNNSYWASPRDAEDLWHITRKCATNHHNNFLRGITLFELMMEICKNDI